PCHPQSPFSQVLTPQKIVHPSASTTPKEKCMSTSFHASNPNKILGFEAVNSFGISAAWHIFL
ncbi:MAG: hypothetical protein IIY06_07725, partial [Proteobacteria bacterium]|nr:hypothetical protein [Pseudomonadota bacterium]